MIKEENSAVNLAVFGEFTIARQTFQATLERSETGLTIGATWQSSDPKALSLKALLAHFGIAPPGFLPDLSLEKVSINHENNSTGLVVTCSQGLKVCVQANAEDAYELSLAFDIMLHFAGIPVLGKLLDEEDGICIESFSVKKTKQGITISLGGEIKLNGNPAQFNCTWDKQEAPETLGGDADGQDIPRWIKVDKSFKVVTLHRLGFSFKGDKLTILVDSSFSLSVLSLSFYELFVATKIPPAFESLEFGLSGLMVSYNKPPLTLSGGLYRNKNVKDCPYLYDGEIQVGFSNFRLTALGSYGELSEGEKSLFIYLALNYPLGGPTFFYVTGLSGGFGINRKFMLPALKDVRTFPLVAIATNTASKKPDTPAAALNELSAYLSPSPGDYFITAGVAFKSFNLLNSFALLTVAFGKSLNVSLLGICEMSLPPNTTEEDKRIAYAQLNLKAVYDQAQGDIRIEAMLTNESYLLSKSCKLTGGFAFYLWTKGQHKGDFAVTLGGFAHPDFSRPAHYPVVDTLGINWKISDNLSVSGYAYFGLTPSCIMAGGGLSMQYESGRIKAWFTANMDLLIKWKPFYFDFRVAVALGASYRGILTTYRLEMKVDLHLWGPEFAGTAHISWFIISFTIHFGNKAEEPKHLEWAEFYDSFMPKALPRQTGTLLLETANPSEVELISVRATGGIVAETKNPDTLLVNPIELELEIHCELPFQTLTYNEDEILKSEVQLGVVPMGIPSYNSSLAVTISCLQANDQAQPFIIDPLFDNLSPALWLNKAPEPDINARPISDVPTGLRVRIQEAFDPAGRLPKNGRYRLETLEKHESITRTFKGSNAPIPTNPKQDEDPMESIKKTLSHNALRDKLMKAASKHYQTCENAVIQQMGQVPERFFLDNPSLCTSGAPLTPGEVAL